MANQTLTEECVSRLKLLADPTRLQVMRCLMSGARHVGEINAEIGVDQSLLSHHLKLLRDANLVIADRDGKSVLYRLSPEVLGDSELSGHLNLGCCQLSF